MSEMTSAAWRAAALIAVTELTREAEACHGYGDFDRENVLMQHVGAIKHLTARAEAAERERDALREAVGRSADALTYAVGEHEQGRLLTPGDVYGEIRALRAALDNAEVTP